MSRAYDSDYDDRRYRDDYRRYRGRRAYRHGSGSTHSVLMGYLLWIFGFMGSHRFYYGRPITGIIWFFTFGLCFIGWIIDLLFIPGMSRTADRRYYDGDVDYNLAWILLTFLGVFGIHRFYMGKVFTGLLYLFTLGLCGLGVLYDYLTLNEQIDRLNEDDDYRSGYD